MGILSIMLSWEKKGAEKDSHVLFCTFLLE